MRDPRDSRNPALSLTHSLTDLEVLALPVPGGLDLLPDLLVGGVDGVAAGGDVGGRGAPPAVEVVPQVVRVHLQLGARLAARLQHGLKGKKMAVDFETIIMLKQDCIPGLYSL